MIMEAIFNMEDFGAPDETLLSENFDKPIGSSLASGIKAFYMKRDEENNDLALGVDMIAPEGYGEIIGGGQREDDLDILIDRIRHHDLPLEPFKWYLDLRKYGSVPTKFGLGLERTVAWICGTKNTFVKQYLFLERCRGLNLIKKKQIDQLM